jgi:DNA-binding CsgD family transcriptional regulator
MVYAVGTNFSRRRGTACHRHAGRFVTALDDRSSAGMDDAAACKQRIVKLVPRFLPVARCCVYEIDRNLVPTRHVNSDGDARWVVAYRDYFHRIDPCRPSRFARSDAVVVASDRLMPLDALMQTEYFRGFMRPMGALHKVELFFRDASGRMYAGLRVTRTAEQGCFTGADVQLLQELQPLLDASLACSLRHDIPALEPHLRALSRREQEVALLVLQGLSNKEICRRLGTSLPTVKTQLRSVFRKLRVAGRCELAALALHGGMGGIGAGHPKA